MDENTAVMIGMVVGAAIMYAGVWAGSRREIDRFERKLAQKLFDESRRE